MVPRVPNHVGGVPLHLVNVDGRTRQSGALPRPAGGRPPIEPSPPPARDEPEDQERRRVREHLHDIPNTTRAESWATIWSASSAANARQAAAARAGRHPERITAASAMNPRPPLIPDWNWC